MNKANIWIVAAGTGGHILPGVEVADQLKALLEERSVQPVFTFFGTKDRLESKIIPKEGYALKTLWVKPWMGRGVFAKLLGIFSMLVSSVVPIFHALSKGKPRLLFSVGGYVSVPVSIAAIVLRVPIFILEPNIKAGASNRMLSRFAKMVYSVPHSDAEKVMRCKVLNFGNPVRQSFEPVAIRSQVETICILGGSQGARILCESGLEVFKELLSWNPKLRLILQAGERNFDYSTELAAKLEITKKLKIYSFVRDMPKLLSVSDVVIARAGAMTLSELAQSGLPTVLVPYPHAADDHQRVNAKILEKQKAVRVVEEGESFTASLSATLRELILSSSSFQQRIQLSQSFKQSALQDAGKNIAKDMLENIALI